MTSVVSSSGSSVCTSRPSLSSSPSCEDTEVGAVVAVALESYDSAEVVLDENVWERSLEGIFGRCTGSEAGEAFVGVGESAEGRDDDGASEGVFGGGTALDVCNMLFTAGRLRISARSEGVAFVGASRTASPR